DLLPLHTQRSLVAEQRRRSVLTHQGPHDIVQVLTWLSLPYRGIERGRDEQRARVGLTSREEREDAPSTHVLERALQHRLHLRVQVRAMGLHQAPLRAGQHALQRLIVGRAARPPGWEVHLELRITLQAELSTQGCRVHWSSSNRQGGSSTSETCRSETNGTPSARTRRIDSISRSNPGSAYATSGARDSSIVSNSVTSRLSKTRLTDASPTGSPSTSIVRRVATCRPGPI